MTNLPLEDKIKINRDWINPLLAIFFGICSILVLMFSILMTIEYLLNPPLIPDLYFYSFFTYTDIFLYSIVALATLLVGTFFFLWFGLGTQKCNIGTFGFGFGVPSSGVLLACSGIYFSYQKGFLSLLVISFSLACVILGVLLYFLRHWVDRIIIIQLYPFNDEITELNLQAIHCPYGMLRFQRAIERGIRAQYLNQYYYIDREKLIKSNIKIIEKKNLYQNVRAPWRYFIFGYVLCGVSAFMLIAYITFKAIFILFNFSITFTLGILLVDYYSIRTLNLRKTILIIDHWLRRNGEVDLGKLDKLFGFLPIKYPILELKRISKRYEVFIGAELIEDQLLKSQGRE